MTHATPEWRLAPLANRFKYLIYSTNFGLILIISPSDQRRRLT